MALTSLRPMLQVNDMATTVRYWTESLGFTVTGEVDGEAGAPPAWCNLARDGVAIMFTWEAEHSHDDGSTHRSEAGLSGSLYFNVEDVDALGAELRERPGVGPVGGPVDQPHGMRELYVQDPNGFRICFGQPL